MRRLDAKAMVNGEDEHALLNSGKGSILKEERPSSSSSSSGSSAEEKFVQRDAGELGKPIEGNENIHTSNSKLPPQDAALPSEVVTQEGEMGTPDSFSSRFDAGDIDDSAPVAAKESPPAQVMVRSDVPDPYRIPSTVFESRSTTPANWSVASNESLFSIHVGNSSFSRDHALLLGRSGDLSCFPSSPPDAHASQPTVLEPDAKEMENGRKQAVTAEAANAKAMADVLNAAADGHVDKEKPQVGSVRNSTSTSRHSDASTHSFAFPILAGGGSMKVEPESQSQQAADHNEAPEVVPDAANTMWFPCCSCSFCC